MEVPRTPAVLPEEGEDEYQLIVRVLKESNGVVAGPKGAAQRLGLKRTTLLSRMKRLGINKDELVEPRALPLSAPVRGSAGAACYLSLVKPLLVASSANHSALRFICRSPVSRSSRQKP